MYRQVRRQAVAKDTEDFDLFANKMGKDDEEI